MRHSHQLVRDDGRQWAISNLCISPSFFFLICLDIFFAIFFSFSPLFVLPNILIVLFFFAMEASYHPRYTRGVQFPRLVPTTGVSTPPSSSSLRLAEVITFFFFFFFFLPFLLLSPLSFHPHMNTYLLPQLGCVELQESEHACSYFGESGLGHCWGGVEVCAAFQG